MIDASDFKKQDAMPILCDVVIPIRTWSRDNERVHWRTLAERTKAEREAVCVALGRLPLVTVGRELVQGGKRRTVRSLKARPVALRAVLTRLSPGAGLDDDNLRGSLKACRDELAAWLGVDDADPSVVWGYAEQKTKRGLWGVRLLVLDASGAVVQDAQDEVKP